MKLFFLFTLLFLTSCAYQKQSFIYFSECEEQHIEFSNLLSCAFDNLKKDCNEKSSCQYENKRFVKTIKRLQLMVDSKEISENEAMFRYYKLIDFEESNFRNINRDSRDLPYSFDKFYIRGMPACYYSRNRFCY